MRPHGRAIVSVSNPSALGVCDRCGFLFNLPRLDWQYQWAGSQLQNLRLRVCDDCMDKPQEQIRAIIIPPDPVPVDYPRPERYDSIVPSFLATQDGDHLTTLSTEPLISEIKTTPTSIPPSSAYTFENEV